MTGSNGMGAGPVIDSNSTGGGACGDCVIGYSDIKVGVYSVIVAVRFRTVV